MKPVLIFSGTTEGRKLAYRLAARGIPSVVSVATDYGAEVMEPHAGVEVIEGRMDREAMAEAMRMRDFLCVVDATHPFAVLVSQEIKAACEHEALSYLRLSRSARSKSPEPGQDAAAVWEEKLQQKGRLHFFDDVKEAALYLREREGNILLTTGSKELRRFSALLDDEKRLYVRVLPSIEAIRACEEIGLCGKQIFAVQGPFSTAMNRVFLKHADARFLLTKESGEAGGYPQKLEAAACEGAVALVLRDPERGSSDVERMQEQDLYERILSLSGMKQEAKDHAPALRCLTIAGMGPGSRMERTRKVQRALEQAEILFGAETVLKALSDLPTPKEAVYRAEEIAAWLCAHPKIRRAVAVYAGDIGFYSGASGLQKKMQTLLSGNGEQGGTWTVQVLNGISSVSYLAGRLGICWQNAALLSAHGRRCNVIGHVRTHGCCFLLLSGVSQLRQIGAGLEQASACGILGTLRIYVGYQLSCPEEKIWQATTEELQRLEAEGLYTLCILHSDGDGKSLLPGIADAAFQRRRRSVPMTKEEIRTLALCKLRLSRHFVLYDVGAGTGSVSIEAALCCEEGFVYSIEKKTEACELLRQNQRRFLIDNMEIVETEAPDGLDRLPVPTHLFIGGSSGRAEEIIAKVQERNPQVRVVMTCVSLETLGELKALMRRYGDQEPELLQLQVSRGKTLGAYHLLEGQNPVFLLSFGGEKGIAESISSLEPEEKEGGRNAKPGN